MFERRIASTRILLLRGDITEQEVDAVVNAANTALAGGGGVDGAIHRAGGPEIMDECRRISGGCPTGQAVITGAGRLPARYVIHAVGPTWQGGNNQESALLAKAYQSSLTRALEANVKTLALPSISTGAFRYPLAEAAGIAIETVARFCRENDQFEEIRFVLFDDTTFGAYRLALETLP